MIKKIRILIIFFFIFNFNILKMEANNFCKISFDNLFPITPFGHLHKLTINLFDVMNNISIFPLNFIEEQLLNNTLEIHAFSHFLRYENIGNFKIKKNDLLFLAKLIEMNKNDFNSLFLKNDNRKCMNQIYDKILQNIYGSINK